MPEYDQNVTLPAKAGQRSSPPTPPGYQGQISEMRKELEKEIKELKKQVMAVQLHSFKIMQQSMQSVFKAQAKETKKMIQLQEKELEEQVETGEKKMEEEEKTLEKMDTQVGIISGKGPLEEQYQAALRVVKVAQQSVDRAMQAAQKSIKDAENILKNG